MNDAFDVEFDRQHRQARPIPSGIISVRAVWGWGIAWLVAGVASLFWFGWKTGILGLALAALILVYDATHKRISWAPVLMGGCRTLLYLVSASTAARGVTALVGWFGIALGAYIVGLSYLARRESVGGAFRIWPLLLLASPVAVTLACHGFNQAPLLLSVVFVLWGVRSLRPTFSAADRNIGLTVANLLAGIVLVDWLAAVNAPRELGFVFIALFLSARVLQRVVPAT